MKGKYFFLATVLIALFFIIQPSSAQEIDCDYSDPSLTYCTGVFPDYNTTVPFILLDFQEIPVTIRQIQLISWNTSESKPLTLISSVPDVNPSNFTYRPTNHLTRGLYGLRVLAEDNDANEMLLDINFSITPISMNIFVSRPINNHIPQPNFGVGNTEVFRLELSLERPALCRYSYTAIPSSVNLSEAYLSNTGFSFARVQGDLFKNEIASLNMSKVVSGYSYDGDLRKMYMICKEDAGEEYTYQEIYVGSDYSAPIITAGFEPHPVIDPNTKATNMTIMTTDLSVCTIENVVWPNTGIRIGNIIRNPSYDFTSFGEFNSSYTERIGLPPQNPSPANYTMTVVCDNMANNRSAANFTLEAKYEGQSVNFIYPPSVVNKRSFDVNVSIVISGDACSYSFNTSNPTDWKPLTRTSTTINGRTLYTAKATVPSDGEKTLSVQCDFMSGPAEHELLVDTIPPYSPNITTHDNTCSLSKLTASFDSEDPEPGSGVDRYHYNLTIPSKPEFEISGVSNGDISVRIEGDELEGQFYTLNVRAEDEAGNIGIAKTKQIKVTNNSIPQCDFGKPDAIYRAKKDNETTYWNVTIDCEDPEPGSGCMSTFRYDILNNESLACKYQLSKPLNDTIVVQESAIICYAVFDNNNNNDTGRKTLITEYKLHCYNNIKDQGETDVDCGGECAKCDLGQNCTKRKDCASNYCFEGVCTEASCYDGVKNGLEAGVDCGGQSNCGGCAINASCVDDYDCVSLNCEGGSCKAASCFNDKIDGFESDLNCGGDCPPCSTGLFCQSDADCESGYCDSTGTCRPEDEKPAYLDEGQYDDYEFGDELDEEELNPLGIWILAIGVFFIFVGAGILIYEALTKEKTEYEEEYSAPTGMIQLPKPIVKDDKKLNPDEMLQMEKSKAKAIRERVQNRRKILSEFSSSAADKSSSIDSGSLPDKLSASSNKNSSTSETKKPNSAPNPAIQKLLPKKQPGPQTNPEQKNTKVNTKAKTEEEPKKDPKKEEDIFETLKKISKKKN